MKRLLTLLLLLPIFAIAQDTHTLPSGTIQIPAGALRYKAITPDSLNQLWLINTLTGKANRIFTATESNLLFAPIVGGGYVPTTRTLTIAGVTYDLSANRIWTLATHSLGYGLSGSTYNGSTGVSWAVDSTLLAPKSYALSKFIQNGTSAVNQSFNLGNGTGTANTFVTKVGGGGSITLNQGYIGATSFPGSNLAFGPTMSYNTDFGHSINVAGAPRLVVSSTGAAVTGIVSAASYTVNGTGGNGYIFLPAQSSAPTTPSSTNQLIYANSTGAFTILGSNGFAATLSKTALTASRTYILPDSAGRFALTSNTADFIRNGTTAVNQDFNLGTGSSQWVSGSNSVNISGANAVIIANSTESGVWGANATIRADKTQANRYVNYRGDRIVYKYDSFSQNILFTTPTADNNLTIPNKTGSHTFAFLDDLTGGYVPLTRTVTAGVGLSGGGALSSNITLNADTVTVLAGKPYVQNYTYTKAQSVPATRTVATFPLSSDVTLATLSAANGILMGNYNGSTGRTVALDTSIAVSKTYAGRYVPYDGATKSLDLGTNLLIAGQVRASNLSSTMVKATSIGTLTAATSGTDYEPALTFNGGLSRTSNTVSVDQGYGFSWTAAQTFGANILLGANNTYSIGSNTNNLSTVYTRSLSANAALTFNTTSTDALIFKTNGVERFRTDGSTGNTTFGTNVDNNRGLVQVEGFATIKQTRFGAIGVDSLMGHATNGDLVRFAPDAYLTPAAASALFITPSSGNTLTNKSISGATNTLTAIPNSALTNSTISGISLGSNLAALTATDATLTFSGSYNGGTARTVGVNTANSFTWTGVNTYQFNALGASTTDATAYVNSTAAISGTQQVSPGTRWSGNGFGTTAGTSQAVEFRAYVSPSQGTTASGSWTLQSQVNGGGWSDRLFLSSGGNFTIGGMVASSRTAVGTGSTDGLVASNTTAATSGSTVQNSTRVRWSGAAWNTTATAATNTMEAVAELVPVSGSSPSSIWRLGFQNSTLASGLSYPFTVTSTGVINSAALTASQAVFTDASKNLVSNAITGTGNVVMSASPTMTNPVVGTQAVGDNSTKAASTAFVQANNFIYATRLVTANTTVTSADYMIRGDASGGAITILLESSPVTGIVHVIKKVDAVISTVSIGGNGKNIDGSASINITNPNTAYVIQYNGTSWDIISSI